MFSILGPLEVRLDGRPVQVGPPKQRLVLAMLLCEPDAPVSVERLTSAIWPGAQPRNARKSLQVYVSNLRRALRSDDEHPRISFEAAGYRIAVGLPELDLLRFEQLAQDGAQGIRAGASSAGANAFKEALDLWRGPALREFEHVEVVRQVVERMTQRRLSVFEQWVDTELTLGNVDAVLEPLAELALEHPLRERLRAFQMAALHRSGRPAEALAVHDEVRQGLAREFGLDPGPAIRKAYRELLSSGAKRPVSRPPAPVDRVRGRLPHDLGDFTGRVAETQRVIKEMAQARAPRRLVLFGQVGSGKTTLAVHAAHRLRPEFADGCILIRLRNGDGTQRSLTSVLAELWQIADVSGAMPPDSEAAVAVWQAHLAGRELLLILDDARDVTLVRRLAPETEQSAALITSRSRLTGLSSATRLDVPVLGLDCATELLGRIIGAARTGRDPTAAETVVRSTGLLPLAIRAAGDKLDALRHVPLADFARRIDGCWQRLDRLGVGDVSVRFRLDAALDDLPSATRRMLYRLSTLPLGPFTLRDAAAATGLDDEAACELLETLIENSTITAPAAEVAAHLAHFELPCLLHVRLRESVPARRTDRAPFWGTRPVAVRSGVLAS
jgi:DNA-binding SARP family transcriptional activator